MNFSTIFKLLWILLTPAVTRTPRQVLSQLRVLGKERLPTRMREDLNKSRPTWAALRFMARWLDGEQISRHHGQWVLNSFLPPFPGPAFERMFSNLLSGRRLSPVSAFLAVTAECPYDCWHCSYANRRPGHLLANQWRDILIQLQKLGTSIVGFTGGEPLMREDLAELIGLAHELGMATILFTTGHGLTAEKARQLKRVGLWSVCTSLDHTDPTQYNRQRGSAQAFDQALASIRHSREAGIYTMVGAVATRDFVAGKRHSQIYRLARQLRVHEVRFVEPMPCGRIAKSDHQAFLTPEQIREIRDYHVRINRRGRLPKVCAFNHIESPELFGCGAGTQHLFIDAAGHVCPCDFTPLSFGKATETPLTEIWQTMSTAMGNPRRHCFIQHHHDLIHGELSDQWPLSTEKSLEICQKIGPGALPDYFAFVTGQANWPEDN